MVKHINNQIDKKEEKRRYYLVWKSIMVWRYKSNTNDGDGYDSVGIHFSLLTSKTLGTIQ